MKKLLSLLAVLVLTFACSKGGDKVMNAPESGDKEAPKTGAYVAKVNGELITKEDVEKEMKALPPQVRAMFMSEGGMEGFVEELVKKELLYQEAKKKGLEGSDALKKKMEEFRKLMMIELLLEEVVEKKAEVTEKEAKEFYEKNKSDFVVEKKKGKKETIEFERVKELLLQKLASEKQKQLFDSYVSGLKSSNSVELNKEAIAALSNKTDKDTLETVTPEKTKTEKAKPEKAKK